MQRHSPDWLKFDIESSRQFLRYIGLKDHIVVEFAKIWDRTFRIDYRHFRAGVKEISAKTYAAVTDASVVTLEVFQMMRIEPTDLVVFVDDDDWLAPDLFAQIRREAGPDGGRWGSIRVGMFEPPRRESMTQQIELLPLEGLIDTNNYAVSGALLRRIGLPDVFEHHHAQKAREAGKFQPRAVEKYLSAANKHPCCTMAAKYFLESGTFLGDPKGTVQRNYEKFRSAEIPDDARWISVPLRDYRALYRKAVA